MSHQDSHYNILTPELSALKACFEAWRNNPTKSGKIPVELREEVIAAYSTDRERRFWRT